MVEEMVKMVEETVEMLKGLLVNVATSNVQLQLI